MKIIISEQVCKEICKNIKLKKTSKTYKKTLLNYYEAMNDNKGKEFSEYVLSMAGYSL